MRHRAHGENGHGRHHYTAAGHRHGDQNAAAATRNERTQWPSPGRQVEEINTAQTEKNNKINKSHHCKTHPQTLEMECLALNPSNKNGTAQQKQDP